MTQNLSAVFKRAGPSLDLLHLTEWKADAIDINCPTFDDVKIAANIIRTWEMLAGGPWSSELYFRRVDFIKTLVADA